MRSLEGRVDSRPTITRRGLTRRCRQALYEAASENWQGTRSGLRRCVRELIKPMRGRIRWMLSVVREARFAALVAGAVLTMGLAGPASASPPIQLSDITAGTGGFVIDGEAQGVNSGQSVSGAGDVNGDGLADLIFGRVGGSYVVFGKAMGTLVQLSDVTAGSGGFAIERDPPGSTSGFAGFAVSAAGDVNGDRMADLILAGGGRIYVIFGRAAGVAVQLSDVTAGMGGFEIAPEAEGYSTASSVSGAGDVNGDGLDDLIIGASGADSNGFDSGRSYVVFGKTTGSLVQLSDVASGTGGFAIDGETDFAYSGLSVSGAGDVNGDGLADLIVGSIVARGYDFRSVQAHVVFGKATGALVQLSDVTAGSGGFAINGEAGGYTRRTVSVSTAGDVNGDGLADLIVGDRYADSKVGRSYVVFGKATGTAVQLLDVRLGIGGSGFAINGERFFTEPVSISFSGESVSAAGDVNGDGLADVIIGAPGLIAVPGRSYVVFGKVDTTPIRLSDVTAGAGGFAMLGEQGVIRSGVSVSGGDDVDGDGLADLIIGAIGADPNGINSGWSYVVFSAETAAASATYVMKTLPGDGAGGFVAPVTDFGDVARATIDFSDGDLADNGSGGASTETVTIRRSNSGLLNILPLSDVANVIWEISSDRVGFTDAIVTLKYLDSEIAGISGTEDDLAVFIAPSIREQWTRLATTIDAARNEVSATVTGFGFFAIGNASTIMTPIPPPPVSTDSIVQFLLGLQSDPTDLDQNQDSDIDVADVLHNIQFVEPKASTTPSPASGATDVPIDSAFDWEDPDSRSDTFDFVLSVANGPSTPTLGLTQSQLTLSADLDYSTTYMWQITSNNVAASIEGPVWSFTTEDEPVPLPGPTSSPSPTDGNTGIGVGSFLQWAAAADATSYDLFLWPSADPQPGTPTGADIMDTSFNPDLVADTQYSWQVVSKNLTGQTACPIWTFTTAPAIAP